MSVIGLSLWGAAPVGADPALFVSPNPVTVDEHASSATVQVEWAGLVPGQLVFVDVCWRSIGEAAFDPALDCGQYSQVLANGTASGAGTAQLELFRGQDPAGEAWGCYAPDDTPPAGVIAHTTCYVRVTDSVVSNLDGDSEVAISFSGPGRVDPGTSAGGGDPARPPTLAPTGAAAPPPVQAAGTPSGDPAPGESLMVAGSAAGSGVSITG